MGRLLFLTVFFKSPLDHCCRIVTSPPNPKKKCYTIYEPEINGLNGKNYQKIPVDIVY